jgi:hypothetical protein
MRIRQKRLTQLLNPASQSMLLMLKRLVRFFPVAGPAGGRSFPFAKLDGSFAGGSCGTGGHGGSRFVHPDPSRPIATGKLSSLRGTRCSLAARGRIPTVVWAQEGRHRWRLASPGTVSYLGGGLWFESAGSPLEQRRRASRIGCAVWPRRQQWRSQGEWPGRRTADRSTTGTPGEDAGIPWTGPSWLRGGAEVCCPDARSPGFDLAVGPRRGEGPALPPVPSLA